MGNRQQLAQVLSQQIQQGQQGQSQGILAQPPSNVQQMPGGYGTSPQFRQLLGAGPQAAQGGVFGEHPEIVMQRQAAEQARLGGNWTHRPATNYGGDYGAGTWQNELGEITRQKPAGWSPPKQAWQQ